MRPTSGVLRLTVLGSGDAFSAAGALHSGYLLEHDGGRVLLECGPAILAAIKRRGRRRAGAVLEGLDAVVISHLHGDHFGGLPFLFLQYTVATPRQRPLLVVGPPGTAARVADLSEALYPGPQGKGRRLPFQLDYLEVGPGDLFEAAGVSAEAFEVPHSAVPFSLGYRFEAGGASVLFSGDSAWSEEFVERSRGVDLFLCECCDLKPAGQGHLSYQELLANRGRLGCKRLLLTHLGDEVRRGRGLAAGLDAELATDGMTVELGPGVGT
ncbi:MAG: MBL fold metallo-hydrolase [Deltaproteobacteria bacterium]